eukprot:sb/3469654/
MGNLTHTRAELAKQSRTARINPVPGVLISLSIGVSATGPSALQLLAYKVFYEGELSLRYRLTNDHHFVVIQLIIETRKQKNFTCLSHTCPLMKTSSNQVARNTGDAAITTASTTIAKARLADFTTFRSFGGRIPPVTPTARVNAGKRSCYFAIRSTFACLRRQNGLLPSLECNSNLSQVLISTTYDPPVTTEQSLGPGIVSSLNYSCILVEYLTKIVKFRIFGI